MRWTGARKDGPGPTRMCSPTCRLFDCSVFDLFARRSCPPARGSFPVGTGRNEAGDVDDPRSRTAKPTGGRRCAQREGQIDRRSPALREHQAHGSLASARDGLRRGH